VPIIIDSYNLNPSNYNESVKACAKALQNGSVIIAIWQNGDGFMQDVHKEVFGRAAYGYQSGTIKAVGLWNGDRSNQADVFTSVGGQGDDGPYMTTLTEAYDWSIRMANGQPYHPTLYP
jgi:hypothetical protein